MGSFKPCRPIADQQTQFIRSIAHPPQLVEQLLPGNLFFGSANHPALHFLPPRVWPNTLRQNAI